MPTQKPPPPDGLPALQEGGGFFYFPILFSHFGEDSGASCTDVRMGRVGADGGIVLPAAFAFFAGGRGDGDFHVPFLGSLRAFGSTFGALHEGDGADDAEVSEEVLHFLEGFVAVAVGVDGDVCIEGVADLLGYAGIFQRLGDDAAQSEAAFPFLFQRFVEVLRLFSRPVGEMNAFFHVRGLGHDLPYFFGGEGDDRRHDAHEGGKYLVHGGLRAPAEVGVGGLGVEAVFQDVQIDGGEVHGAEIVYRMIHHVELVFFHGGGDFVAHPFHAEQRPAVEFFHLVIGDGVGGRVEIGEIAQEIPEGVADLAVHVAHALDDLVAQTDVALVVHAGDPQTEHVGAVLVDDLLRSDHVAHGLGHLAAFFIHGEAVGEDGLVRSAAVDGDAGEEGAVEPAAVLVGPFEVHFAGIIHAFALTEDAVPGGAGVEPHVHDVLFLVEMGAAAEGALVAFGQELFRGVSPPCVGAFLFDDVHDVLHGVFIDDVFAAVVAVEGRDRHAPGALTGNAPVLTVADHVVQTVMAPCRIERGGIHRSERVLAVGIDGSKPLVRRTVDDRVLAAPAVRVLMVDVLLAEEHPCMSELHDLLHFRIPYGEAREIRVARFVGHIALRIDRAERIQIELAFVVVFLYHFEVVHAVSRSGMNAAGAGIEGDVVAFQNIGRTVDERMMERGQFPFRAEHFTTGEFPVFHLAFLESLRSKLLVHEVVFVRVEIVHPYIGEFRVHADGEVRRDGPRRRGPDDGEELLFIHAVRAEALDVHGREFHVDGGRLAVLIFDLCFCQCGLAVRAPVHGLLALVDVALVGHLAEYFQLVRFQLRVIGHVGMIPVADDAEADEIRFLDRDPFLRIGQAFPAQFQRGHGGPVLSGILQYGVFDGQAVRIPAGDVIGVEAAHSLVFHDDILDGLVHRMADVDLAVCIRRAVVEHKFRRAVTLRQTLVIEVHILPEFDKFRFLFRQIAAHRKIRLRQMQSLAVIHSFLLQKKIPPPARGEKQFPWYHPHDLCGHLVQITVSRRSFSSPQLRSDPSAPALPLSTGRGSLSVRYGADRLLQCFT